MGRLFVMGGKGAPASTLWQRRASQKKCAPASNHSPPSGRTVNLNSSPAMEKYCNKSG